MSSVDRYGRLLSAYPARLRRRYGPELVVTMVEMAGPDGRPSRADEILLVLDGLRERFRPPARGPLALAMAVLALLIGGALGSATGSWAGSLAYAALPDAQTFGQRILSADGEVSSSSTSSYFSAGRSLPGGTDVRQLVQESHRRLTAEGWRTSPIRYGGIVTGYSYSATKGGVRLDVDSASDASQGGLSIGMNGRPERPAVYLPLTVAGALLGMVAGWLTGTALAHRIRAARRTAVSAAIAVTGLLLAVPSAAGHVASLLSYLTSERPAPTGGTLLHEQGFAFGPTAETLLSLNLLLRDGSFFVELYPMALNLQRLWILGLVLVAVGAMLARPGSRAEAMQPGAA